MMIDQAIAKRQDALAVEPNRYDELRQIARLNEVKGDFHTALQYRQRYADLFPEQEDSFTELARLYQVVGEFDRSRENYKKALLLSPDNVVTLAALVGVERSTGNFEDAVQYCEEGLTAARTAADSSTVLAQIQLLQIYRGQGRAAVESFEKNVEVMSRWQNPLNVMVMQLFNVGTYVMANQEERAFEIIKEIEANSSSPVMDPFISASYLIAYGYADDPANVERAQIELEKFEDWVNMTNSENLRWVVEMCRANVHYWQEDWESALRAYELSINTMPQNNVEVLTFLYAVAAEACLNLGRIEQGVAFAEQGKAIDPFNPYSHVMLARLAYEQGRKQEAMAYLDKALYVYEVADPDFRWARQARELKAQWEQSL